MQIRNKGVFFDRGIIDSSFLSHKSRSTDVWLAENILKVFAIIFLWFQKSGKEPPTLAELAYEDTLISPYLVL